MKHGRQTPAWGRNLDISEPELYKIRQLEDFDLTMFLSEIHEHDWETAKKLLKFFDENGNVTHEQTNRK